MAEPIFAMIIPLSAPVYPAHPIAPPGSGLTPMPPIYYPPVFPAHPIAPGGPPVGPAHPIAPGGPPPGIWGGAPPMPSHPIAPGGPPPGAPVDPGYGVEAPPIDAGAEGGWVWSPYYGWVWQPRGSGGKPKPPSVPPVATQLPA